MENHIYAGKESVHEISGRLALPLPGLIRYLDNLHRHIEAVLEFGQVLGVDEERLYMHDASKWSDAELPGYVLRYGEDVKDDASWLPALLHHLNNNDHHWQHWLIASDERITAVPMPEQAVREMLADWMAANFAYSTGQPNPQKWIDQNAAKITLHPSTAEILRTIAPSVGLRWPYV